jgi:hypothetical protein
LRGSWESKKYVRNRARPEGSISKGYGTEEVIGFCVNFLPDLKPIGVPKSWYEGRLSGKGTLGKKAMIFRDGHTLNQEHYTVLQSSTFMALYIMEHMNVVCSKFPGRMTTGLKKITWRLDTSPMYP